MISRKSTRTRFELARAMPIHLAGEHLVSIGDWYPGQYSIVDREGGIFDSEILILRLGTRLKTSLTLTTRSPRPCLLTYEQTGRNRISSHSARSITPKECARAGLFREYVPRIPTRKTDRASGREAASPRGRSASNATRRAQKPPSRRANRPRRAFLSPARSRTPRMCRFRLVSHCHFSALARVLTDPTKPPPRDSDPTRPRPP